MVRLIGVLVLLCWCGLLQADTLKVAVAANFKPTLNKLKADFEKTHSIRLKLSSASTGVLYAQIKNGAPFDVFLSADAHRAVLLDKEELVVPRSRHTYVTGRLALWLNQPQTSEPNLDLLSTWPGKIAIANPKTAPYGAAAQEVLDRHHLTIRPVTGANVGQAYQFVVSGNVQLGFVALSQVAGKPNVWQIPQSMYSPITQQGVILKRSKKPKQAETFMLWLTSEKTQSRLVQMGYGKGIR